MKFKTILAIVILIVGIFFLLKYIPDDIIPDNIKTITDGFDDIVNTSGIKDVVDYTSETKTSIVTTDTAALATMDLDILDESMLDMMYQEAQKTYNKTGKEFIRVESYYDSEPIFALSTSRIDLKNGNYVLEDLRSPDYAITSEVPLFDVLIQDMVLTDSLAKLDLDYVGAEDEFSDNVYAIMLTVLEYAGWVDEIIINFQMDNGQMLQISTTTQSVLDSLDGGNIILDQQIIGSAGTYVDNYSDELDNKDSDEIDVEDSSNALFDCNGEKISYDDYIATYNKLTSLMAAGDGDTPEAQEAYAEYKAAKDCYEQNLDGSTPVSS